MNKILISFTIFGFLAICGPAVNAELVLSVDNSDRKYHINAFGDYLIDSTHAETPEDLVTESDKFVPMERDNHALILGQQSDPVWIRFTLKNIAARQVDTVVEASYIPIDYLDIFIPEGSGYRKVELGDHRPYSNREFDSGPYAITLHLGPGEEQTYFIRAASNGLMFLPVAIYSGKAYTAAVVQNTGYYNLFAGVALGLFLFSLMLGIQTRDKIYLIYSLVVLMRMAWILNTEGLTYKLFDDYPFLIQMTSIAVTGIYAASSLLFHSIFLQFNQLYPKTDVVIKWAACFYFFLGVKVRCVCRVGLREGHSCKGM